MKCVTFDGLGEYMFYDVRFAETGEMKPHPLNDERFAGARILVSGNNFGCGSSREHAPQAIYRFGFRAVIAEGFAEIFFGNSVQLGMPCVSISREDRLALSDALEADPSIEVSIDLESREVRYGDKTIPCTMREGGRHALLSGRWDPLEDLVEALPKVEQVAERLPYLQGA